MDQVLVMSVNPGYPAQRFIPESPRKIARVRSIMDRRGVSAQLEVDGGVNLETAPLVAKAGAADSGGGLRRVRLSRRR